MCNIQEIDSGILKHQYPEEVTVNNYSEDDEKESESADFEQYSEDSLREDSGLKDTIENSEFFEENGEKDERIMF